MKYLNAVQEAKLREIAERHGYRATTGLHARQGNSTSFLRAIVAGDVTTVQIPDEDRSYLLVWLDQAAHELELEGNLVAGMVRDLADQLRAAWSC